MSYTFIHNGTLLDGNGGVPLADAAVPIFVWSALASSPISFTIEGSSPYVQ